MNLKNCKVVRIYDYSDYDPSNCYTGGKYLDWTNYTRIPSGQYRVTYGTSAGFDFCPICGGFTFGNCGCRLADARIIPEWQVALAIINANFNDDYEVRYIGGEDE